MLLSSDNPCEPLFLEKRSVDQVKRRHLMDEIHHLEVEVTQSKDSPDELECLARQAASKDLQAERPSPMIRPMVQKEKHGMVTILDEITSLV